MKLPAAAGLSSVSDRISSSADAIFAAIPTAVQKIAAVPAHIACERSGIFPSHAAADWLTIEPRLLTDTQLIAAFDATHGSLVIKVYYCLPGLMG